MGRVGDVSVAQKVHHGLPGASEIGETISGHRCRPFIAVTLAIKMEMGARDFLIVRIPMRRAAEIETRQDKGCPPPCLKSSLGELDTTASYVEMERFGAIR